MAKDTQANLGFEKQLWDAACVLWGSIPAAEYRQIIVGLIFLRLNWIVVNLFKLPLSSERQIGIREDSV